ncbi:unnamed protein product [Schistocephalus solidus]|uniref:BTB domain-containing protein n=1 Tax=Schistocephalus solidus TaxID=70667 RepID=A0A183TGC6_SCHSO|nr:unnamed protein product [Schistocephalus solidus]
MVIPVSLVFVGYVILPIYLAAVGLLAGIEGEPEVTTGRVSPVTDRILEAFVEYAYTGQMAISLDNLLETLRAAIFLDVATVRDFCRQVIESQIAAAVGVEEHEGAEEPIGSAALSGDESADACGGLIEGWVFTDAGVS